MPIDGPIGVLCIVDFVTGQSFRITRRFGESSANFADLQKFVLNLGH
jgi:hypothetical protein